MIMEREGSTVTFDSEKVVLDAETNGGSAILGHRPPELVQALKDAASSTDQGNFPMISIEKAALAKELAMIAPGELECSLFGVMRGETTDAACKIARGVTGRSRLVTVDGSWYGQTGFALSLSARKDANQFAPLIPDIETIPFGDLSAAREALEGAAALIIEPLQLDNHARLAPYSYLAELRETCDNEGALLIFDETNTSLGRSGSLFYCEAAGVFPDILLIGEALGAGMIPIAVTLMTQRVNAYLNRHPMIHLSTFGGSDVACSVARRVLELVEARRVWEIAKKRGETLRSGLQELVKRHGKRFESISGLGLALSLRLTQETFVEPFLRACAEHGVLMRRARVDMRAVVLTPSLCIGEQELTCLLEALDMAALELET
jgi:acetylornithine/succinyldiaminopimelate/putrescine aminotransferase